MSAEDQETKPSRNEQVRENLVPNNETKTKDPQQQKSHERQKRISK